MKGESSRGVPERYRSSVASRLREISKETGSARREVLQRLRESPLWTLMKEARRGSGVGEDHFSASWAHAEMSRSLPFLGGDASDTVQAFLEGDQLWEDVKSTHTSELVRSALVDSAGTADKTIQDNTRRLLKEIDLSAREREALDREVDEFHASGLSTFVKALAEMGFSHHALDDVKLHLLRSHKDKLPEDIREALDRSDDAAGFFDRLFGKTRQSEAAVLRMVGNALKEHALLEGALESRRKEIARRESSVGQEYSTDDDVVFRNTYGEKLRESIFERIKGNPIAQVASAVEFIRALKRQDEFAYQLETTDSMFSDSERMLKLLSDQASGWKGNVEFKTVELREAIERLPAIDAEYQAIDPSDASSAEEVSAKFRERKRLEAERVAVLEKIERAEGLLPILYCEQTESISKEAVVKSIVEDRDKLNEVLEAYRTISHEVFGVSIEKLESVQIVHQEMIAELERRVTAALNRAIVENTKGGKPYYRSGAAFDMSAMREFVNGGGRALVVGTKIVQKGICREGGVAKEYRPMHTSIFEEVFQVQILDGVSTADLEKKFDFPWPLLVNGMETASYRGEPGARVLKPYRLEDGEPAVWLPIPKGIDVVSMKLAARIYERDKTRTHTRERNCDLFSVDVQVSADVVQADQADTKA